MLSLLLCVFQCLCLFLYACTLVCDTRGERLPSGPGEDHMLQQLADGGTTSRACATPSHTSFCQTPIKANRMIVFLVCLAAALAQTRAATTKLGENVDARALRRSPTQPTLRVALLCVATSLHVIVFCVVRHRHRLAMSAMSAMWVEKEKPHSPRHPTHWQTPCYPRDSYRHRDVRSHL